MKHLLIIIISFLLLSSPVIGQETGVLYQYETSSGFVWKTFGNEKLQPKYEGEITKVLFPWMTFMRIFDVPGVLEVHVVPSDEVKIL